jgi:hypothetical protein
LWLFVTPAHTPSLPMSVQPPFRIDPLRLKSRTFEFRGSGEAGGQARMRCLRTLHAMDAIRLCYSIVGIERTLLPAHILIFLLRRTPDANPIPGQQCHYCRKRRQRVLDATPAASTARLALHRCHATQHRHADRRSRSKSAVGLGRAVRTW